MRALLLPSVALAVALASGCERSPALEDPRAPGLDAAAALAALPVPLSPEVLATARRMSPLPPLPPDPTNRVADDEAAAHYGRYLFYDGRLSRDGSVSCATCHDPTTAFTDGRPLAVGLAQGDRRTPTLWNVAYHRWLTWDGRADSLWMQALDPLEDPREMDATRLAVARFVADDPERRAAHEAVFGPLPGALSDAALDALPERARPARTGDAPDEPEVLAWEALDASTRDAVTAVFVEVGKALAAYQRRLVRGAAPFDRFVAALDTGDAAGLAALSPAALRGLELFVGRGNCVLCHSGPNFSDGEFHNNSLPTGHGGTPRDPGRYRGAAVVKASEFNAAGPFSDARGGERARSVGLLRTSSETWGEFRTPSLRNLAGREPFMHQGQLPDLDAVLEFYSTLEGASGRNHHQERILVPLQLTEGERADLRAFLEALEGDPAPAHLLTPPASPAPPPS